MICHRDLQVGEGTAVAAHFSIQLRNRSKTDTLSYKLLYWTFTLCISYQAASIDFICVSFFLYSVIEYFKYGEPLYVWEQGVGDTGWGGVDSHGEP